MFTLHALLLFAMLSPVQCQAVESDRAAALPGIVRWDWYFRESLAAIRDWETALAAWESDTPEEERTPLLPVPTNGEWVEWPNPIPETLLPRDDAGSRVRVRLIDGQIEATRAGGEPQTVALGEALLGYQHPGGGGKDHWYHAYHRRFDGLAHFIPTPAPFAIEIGAPCDLRRGANDLRVTLRSASEEPITLSARLSFRSPTEERLCAETSITLAPGATESLALPIELSAEGGGVLLLGLNGPSGSYWLPLFTHVETVTAVLDSVAQILRDRPSRAGKDRLAELRAQAAGWPGDGAEWRKLFEKAGALRDQLLLSRIDFGALLFAKRKPYNSEQPFMDAHHLINPPGGGIYRLSPVRPDGEVSPVADSLGDGVYRDIHLHWDAARFLFAFGNGSDQWDGSQSYHIYEAGVDGGGLGQLTDGPKNDCEPFYLPNGQIGFTSDRSEHFVMCGGNRHSPTLFVMEADGSGVRQLSFNIFNDFNPTVLPDGRILYSRWEYNERSVTSLHNPFTMMPDGTMVAPFYGNATIRPNVVMFPRPVPDSSKVMALFTAHHGQTHGPIGLIDVGRGIDGDEPLTILTPNVPITGEKAEDSRHGWFSDPAPLSEDTYLCSFTPTVLPWLEESWALYIGDRHGNLALIYRDPHISCAEPVPLVPRPRPQPLLPASPDGDGQEATAQLLLMDVYEGLPGVPRGEAKYLRILEDVPRKSVPRGGVVTTSGTRIYTIKRILGTVPIESDGSASFVVPANRNVYFEVLDIDHHEIQRMRSVVCLKPDERRTCVGCHEPKTTAPPNRYALAAALAPSHASPPPWGTQTISFLRDVQPVLNAKCIACHTHDRFANGVILTDDLTHQFTVAYEELLPYLNVADAMRWDHPDDVYARPPYTYGSKVSPLIRMLADGHHGVKLTQDERRRLINWVDANGVYYDRYETNHFPNRQIFTDAIGKPMLEVHARRCAECHLEGDGKHDTWWLSINRRDSRLSRALLAPLARGAGGWGRCEGSVFASVDDPDYRALLASLSALHGELAEHPRADLLSIRDTDAQTQEVTMPEPPPPGRNVSAELEGWVYLSDLKWESGASGWAPNKDGLPRLNRSIEGNLLRLGTRRYGKGIGTHAPSEIVYRLEGRYTRLFAEVGGAEVNGTVVFQVFGDDECLFDSGVMQGLRGAKEVDVSVADVQTLRLVVTDAGDNYVADCANWADARLLKASSSPE